MKTTTQAHYHTSILNSTTQVISSLEYHCSQDSRTNDNTHNPCINKITRKAVGASGVGGVVAGGGGGGGTKQLSKCFFNAN